MSNVRIVSVQAQYDNLGDMVIRSEVVRWVANGGTPIAVAGKAPRSYVDGLNLPKNVIVVRSIVAALLRRRSSRLHLIFAPGEQSLEGGPKDWVKAMLNLALAGFVKAQRGVVVKVGKGYKGRGRVLTALERALVRLSDRTLVRDQGARELFPSAELMPDIALSSPLLEPSNEPAHRKHVAISLRDDRLHPDVAVAAVAKLVPDLTPVFVVQVQRDETIAQDMSSRMGAELVAWEGPMAAQLERVKSVYARAEYTVSDRLHSILFALRSGSIPIAVETGSHNKLRRQLAALGLERFVINGWDVDAIRSLLGEDRESLHAESAAALIAAQARLDEVRMSISRELDSP